MEQICILQIRVRNLLLNNNSTFVSNLLVTLETSTRAYLRSIKSIKYKSSEFVLVSSDNLDIYDILNGEIGKSNIIYNYFCLLFF